MFKLKRGMDWERDRYGPFTNSEDQLMENKGLTFSG